MRMLELFAGSKRLAKTFAANGWETETVELKDGQDVLTFEPSHRYDYVHAGPPCQPYSALGLIHKEEGWKAVWDAVPDPLWDRAEWIIAKARPTFHTIENVKGAQWVHGRAPFHYGPYFLWGWYPMPLLESGPLWRKSFKGTHNFTRTGGKRFNDKKTQQEREEYPQEFCDALYQTIKSGFDLQPVEIAA